MDAAEIDPGAAVGTVSLAVGVGLLVARIFVTWGVWHPQPRFAEALLIPPAMAAILAGAVLLDGWDRGGRTDLGWTGIAAAAGATVLAFDFTAWEFRFLAIALFVAGLAAAVVPYDPDRAWLPRDAAVAVAGPGLLVGVQHVVPAIESDLVHAVVSVAVFTGVLGLANVAVLLRRPHASGTTLGRFGLANAAGAALAVAALGGAIDRPPIWTAFLIVGVPLAVAAAWRDEPLLAAPTLVAVPVLVGVQHMLSVYISGLGVA